ncbi:MAG: YdeI/OmpD-associated family protein [Anaerolineae bacterium]|nr:YdeI/OmpD-associated family protein [Anaerolineae bacterium]
MTEASMRLRFHDRASWRAWLQTNHRQSDSVWVVINKKATPAPGLPYEDAVEEALCFGWIDSTLNTMDDRTYALRFSPRRANSIWSESNKARVARLIADGLMAPSGFAAIEEGKANGQWDAVAEREDVDTVPPDLEAALAVREGAVDAYATLSPSRRKQLLYWLASAKRPETRARRIEQIVAEAIKGL